jgi:hypothetical protein
MLTTSVRGRQTLFVLLVGAVVGLPGCGKEAPRLAVVEGQVLVGSEPLKAGTAQRTGYVQLTPDASRGNTSLELPSGTIDSEGHYKIFTNVKEGAALGWYKVTVSADFKPNPNDPYVHKTLIPERYSNTGTSKLDFEVVENPTSGAYDIKLDAR